MDLATMPDDEHALPPSASRRSSRAISPHPSFALCLPFFAVRARPRRRCSGGQAILCSGAEAPSWLTRALRASRRVLSPGSVILRHHAAHLRAFPPFPTRTPSSNSRPPGPAYLTTLIEKAGVFTAPQSLNHSGKYISVPRALVMSPRSMMSCQPKL